MTLNPILDKTAARLHAAYRAAGKTVNKTVVHAKLRPQVEKLILEAFTAPDDGTKEADVDRADVVQLILDRADRALTSAAHRTIKRLIDGEPPFPEICDIVIPLGAGDRCVFGSMGLPEWERWDANQYQNLVEAQDSYRGFRELYDRARPHLHAGAKVAKFWQELGA